MNPLGFRIGNMEECIIVKMFKNAKYLKANLIIMNVSI